MMQLGSIAGVSLTASCPMFRSQGRMRSRFVASRNLPPQVAGPFWAVLASQERRLPARLAAAVLTLFPATPERAPRS